MSRNNESDLGTSSADTNKHPCSIENYRKEAIFREHMKQKEIFINPNLVVDYKFKR
jgi:hypothetical protein